MDRKGEGMKRRGYRRKDCIGKVRWKLFQILQEHGLSIPSVDCFWMQEGAYRKKEWDLARWGADWKDNSGVHFSIYCWDTMTACARYGIKSEADRSRANCFEIFQKSPSRPSAPGE